MGCAFSQDFYAANGVTWSERGGQSIYIAGDDSLVLSCIENGHQLFHDGEAVASNQYTFQCEEYSTHSDVELSLQCISPIAVPENNDCNQALELTLPVNGIQGTTNGATISQNIVGLDFDSFGPMVWYTFIGTGEKYDLSLDCSEPWNAGVKVVSTNGCLEYAGDYFGGGDMCEDGRSIHEIQTRQGQEYHIMVEGRTDPSLPDVAETGNFTLTMQASTTPPSSAPSIAPTVAPTPTPTPRRIQLRSEFGNGIGPATYLTPERDDLGRVLCNRFQTYNPILVTTTDANDPYTEFLLHADGTIESIECTGGLVVTVDRGYDGTSRPLKPVANSCEEGLIRLANRAGNFWDSPHGDRINLGRTTVDQQTWLITEQQGPGYYNDYVGTVILESAMCTNQGLAHNIETIENGGKISTTGRAGLDYVADAVPGYPSRSGTEWRIVDVA